MKVRFVLMKSFWQYIRRVTGKIRGSTVPDLIVCNEDGSQSTALSDFDRAEALNGFLLKQTHLPNCQSKFPNLPAPTQLSPDSFSTTPAEVFNILSGLKPGKAPEGIPPRLLQLCARGISVSLAALFNRSFVKGCVPAAWGEALVIPVHKGGAKSCPSNYRPIALLSLVSKVMKKVVLKRLSRS